MLKVFGPGLATPDMGVVAIVFWTSAECVAIATFPQPPGRWLRLGAALAFGYWWKAILFPVAGVMLLIVSWIAWRRRDDWRTLATAWASFGLLALLLVIPVSRLAGRVTFGETGRLNQLWFVNTAPHLTHLCVGPGMRLPLERGKAVRTQPVVAERPLTCTLPDLWPESTLPLWYDASWWYRDTQPYVNAGETARAVLYALAAVGTVECAWHLSQPTFVELSILRHEIVGDPRPQQLSARVATLLTNAGLMPGARVATINSMWNVDWAQRGGFVVRAYTPDQTISAVTTLQELREPCLLQRYEAALARERVVMAVLKQPEGFRVPDGFEPLDDTGYWIL